MNANHTAHALSIALSTNTAHALVHEGVEYIILSHTGEVPGAAFAFLADEIDSWLEEMTEQGLLDEDGWPVDGGPDYSDDLCPLVSPVGDDKRLAHHVHEQLEEVLHCAGTCQPVVPFYA